MSIQVKDGAGNTVSVNTLPALGAATAANSLPVTLATDKPVSVVPTNDQDPVYDHSTGVKITANTTSQILMGTSATTRFVRINPEADIFINTIGSTAVDNGSSIKIMANVPEIVPVPGNTNITVIAATGTAIVRATALKARS